MITIDTTQNDPDLPGGTQGGGGGDLVGVDRPGARAIIGDKKTSEETKASERVKGQAIRQKGSRWRGSAGSLRKIGEVDVGECFVRNGMRLSAQEAITHRTGKSEPDG